MKLASKKQEPENFEANIERLKLLSHKNWCTKKDYPAETYLTSGEMHIYLENGNPKLAVKVSGVEVVEVQGEKNNTIIPSKYLDELRRYINETQYYLSDDMEFIIDMSQVMD